MWGPQLRRELARARHAWVAKEASDQEPIGSHKGPIGTHRAPGALFQPGAFFRAPGSLLVSFLLGPGPFFVPGPKLFFENLTFGPLGVYFWARAKKLACCTMSYVVGGRVGMDKVVRSGLYSTLSLAW